jgi:hypothetical protein
MEEKMFTTVMLDVPRRIRFSNRALYRVGNLERPLDLSDLRKPKRAFAALAQWLWACLDEPPDCPLRTPEDVAEAIRPERIAELMTTLGDAIRMTQPKEEKNADSSTPSPSPASSSA